MSATEILEAHRSAGTLFSAAGVESFVRREGSGAPVVLIHGVPASSFLYRKMLPELAKCGLEGVAFDLPGLGLASRPVDFDYSWTGLGAFATAAVEALGIDRFHLVVHDIGGPVGFELAAALRGRVRSLTILNTIVLVDQFRRPWSMEPFAWPVVGRLWLASVRKPLLRWLMRLQGVGDRDAISNDEIDVYYELLKREDGGRAFLKIMRGFERTAEKAALYASTIQQVPYPVQVIWGRDDPALRVGRQGARIAQLAGLEGPQELAGKHFVQEEQAGPIARKVAALCTAAHSSDDRSVHAT